MNKASLLRFIDKYTLGGEIKSVKWDSNGSALSTRFISGDKSLVGSVKLDNFKDIESSQVGVYNTAQLVALLNILGDDITFEYNKMGDKYVSVDMADKNGTKSKYMLSDLSVIPTAPDLKNLPSKICPICNRSFDWRKKWINCWEDVIYCSNRCRNRRSQK